MEVAVPKIGFCKSIWVIWQLNIDNYVITMRRNWSGMLNRHMRRAWGRVLDCNMFVHHVAVEVSHYTDSNCLLLRCLIGQHRKIIIYFDVFVYSIVEFHSFMVHNRGLGWGQKDALEYCILGKEVSYLLSHHSCQKYFLLEYLSLCWLKMTQLANRRFVENVYLKKKKRIYSQSLLWILLYKIVVQEKKECAYNIILTLILSSK